MESKNFMKDKENYQKEENQLLKTVLTNRYFKPWKEYMFNPDFNPDTALAFDSVLEIYLTALCNQNCEYCYLIKHANSIYPREFDNKELIMKNLGILYQWIIDEQFFIPRIEFFSGEIWHSQYGLDVLQLTYDYLKKGMKVNSILIPSNCSFLLDEIQTAKIQQYIDDMKQIGVNLLFSISVDGAVIENQMRPLNSKIEKTEEFYERMFMFAYHNNFGFHPMIAAKSVKYWIENFKWWKKKCAEYNMNVYQSVMMLEVRNDDWTDEAIEDYNQFMNFLIDEIVKDNDYNIEKYSNALCHYRLEPTDKDKPTPTGYIPYSFLTCDTFPGCTVANSLTVRIGDLAICPCHRTAYNKNLYGWFVVDNDKIIDIKANNPQMAIKILTSNHNLCLFECDVCPYRLFCLKGCYGAQMEASADPVVNIPGVCKFFRSKFDNLINKYQEIGVLDYIQQIYEPNFWGHNHIKEILDFVKGVKYYHEQQKDWR